MACVEGPFWIEWDSGYVAASLAIGVALSSLAFFVLPRAGTLQGRALVVTLFTLAICGMHFTGMTAATLAFDPLTSLAEPSGIERQSLAIFVAAVALLLLGIGMASAVIDGYLADRSEEHTSEPQSLMRISYAVCCLEKKQ